MSGIPSSLASLPLLIDCLIWLADGPSTYRQIGRGVRGSDGLDTMVRAWARKRMYRALEFGLVTKEYVGSEAHWSLTDEGQKWVMDTGRVPIPPPAPAREAPPMTLTLTIEGATPEQLARIFRIANDVHEEIEGGRPNVTEILG